MPEESAVKKEQEVVSPKPQEGAKPDAGASPPKDEPSAGASNSIVFKGKIDIQYDKPLPHFNVGVNKAYRAVAKDKNRTPLIAVICEKHLTPRLHAAKKYEKIINPNSANLVLHGSAFWPPVKAARYIFIYLENLGKPLLAADQSAALGWKPEDVIEIIVKPMVNILLDFKDKDFVHGGIRLSNLYDGGASGKPKKVILGDCLSAPASCMQPPVYETIERAMASPVARGMGTRSDDLYAFGVTLAAALRTHNPLKDMTPDQVICQKIENGTYATVTGKDRVKGDILELLRGLLHDDPAQRWTIDEVVTWLDGLRLSPKQPITRKKAARAIVFSNEKYYLPQILAMNIGTNPTEAKRIIEDDSLHQWLQRSVEDEAAIERVEKALSSAKQGGTSGTGYEERLVSHISMALDPMAPLRYRGARYLGEGMGMAMVEAMILKQDVKNFADIIMGGLMLDWVGMCGNPSIDTNGLYNKYEQSRRLVKSSKLGEGIERCAYVLCAEAPCMSEFLQSYYINTPYEMLLAFEDMCKNGKAPGTFLDRHAVAFLLQRDSRVIEPFLFELNSSEKHKITLANLKVMAMIQKHYDGGLSPSISQHFASNMAEVYDAYHDRKVRDKIQKAIDAVSEGGDLQKMVTILDNMDLMNKDEKAFKEAISEFAGLEKEKNELEAKLEDKENFGVETGNEMAAIVSSILAAIIVLGVAFMFFTGKSLF